MKKTLIFLAMAAMCITASAQTGPASSDKNIKGSGCVEKAVENSCRVVIDSQTGERCNLLFGAKPPKPGTAIKFSGTEHHGTTACLQGQPVNVSRWWTENGIKCPPPVIVQAGR